MNEDVFILGVPPLDAHDLHAISDLVTNSAEFEEHRYFDGATFIEVILPLVLSTGAWRAVREWIHSRADVQKATRISLDGVEITAVKAKDAERVIKLLLEHLTIKDNEQ